MKSLDKKAILIIENTIYATIATSSLSGEPWNSPVYIVYDESFHFYWASSKTSQHSRNIYENPQVFLVIYDSTAPRGTGVGVFIQAEAVEVTDPNEITKACQVRKARVPDAKQPPEEFIGDHPRRIYRATPKKIWMNQDSRVDGHFVDERVEIVLK